MHNVISNYLSENGLSPNPGPGRPGRSSRGYTIATTKRAGGRKGYILKIVDPELVKALAPHINSKNPQYYVGTYDNETLANNAGKGIMKNKDQLLKQVNATTA